MIKYPLEAFVSFTTKCNLKCKHCYSNSIINGKTIDTIKLMKILKKIRPLRIVFSGGEPLIEFDTLINFLKEYKKIQDSYIVLATNSTFFNKEKLVLLKPFVDRLQISLDSLSRETFMKIRGVDLLDITIENIKLAKKMNFDIQIAFSLFEENLNDIEDIIKFCEENKIDKINVIRQRPTGRSKSKLLSIQVMNAYKRFLSLAKEKEIKIIIHDPIANVLGIGSECGAAKQSIAIDVDCNFKPCPLFEESIKGNFEEIWNSDFFNEVRKEVEECKNCKIKKCGGGCKACSWNIKNKLAKDPCCMINNIS